MVGFLLQLSSILTGLLKSIIVLANIPDMYRVTISGAARGGGAQVARAPPPSHVGKPHKAGIFAFFFCITLQKTTFYHIFKIEWTKSE